MDPAKIVALIDQWNPRAPELQDSRVGMSVDVTHDDFVQKLVFRVDRLDLDTLSVESDERIVLEEAIELCRAALQSWNTDPRSKRKIAGANNWACNNPIIVIRRILSEAEVVEVVEDASADGPPYDLVFISHAATDGKLALLLDTEIQARLPGTSTFIASREEDISDDVWFDTVRQKLQEADAYICIVTPTSHDRHWVIWEHGAAWMSGRRLITTRAGIKNSDLHDAFKYRQTRSLVNPKQAAQIFKALGDSGEDVEAFCEKIKQEVAALAASSPEQQPPEPIDGRWAGGNTAWVNLTRKLPVDLVGDPPVKITDVRAWFTHRDDPDTRYHGQHHDPLPISLGGKKTTVEFNFRFPGTDVPEELRKGKPANLITMSAEIDYVDSEGNAGTFPVKPLAI